MELFTYEKKNCLDTKNHYQQFLSCCYFSLKYTTAIILNLIFIHKLQKGILFSDNKVSLYFTQLVMVCLCCIFQTCKPQKHWEVSTITETMPEISKEQQTNCWQQLNTRLQGNLNLISKKQWCFLPELKVSASLTKSTQFLFSWTQLSCCSWIRLFCGFSTAGRYQRN